MQYVKTADDKIVELHKDGTWRYSESHGPSLKRLQDVTQSPDVVNLVKGLFSKIGVRVIDTNEEFTCTHTGEQLEFKEGVNKKDIEFYLDVNAYQIDGVLRNMAEGYHTELARFYLIREFFLSSQAGKRNSLNNPLVSNLILRFIIKGKNIVHCYLKSPDPRREKDITYTLFHLNGHWNIAHGLCGEPKRILDVSVEDAFDLQRHLYGSMKSDSFIEWFKTAKWYVGWRKKVERVR